MTRIEYDLLREQEPHLRFPRWEMLADWPKTKAKLEQMTREEVLGLRPAKIIEKGFEYYDFQS